MRKIQCIIYISIFILLTCLRKCYMSTNWWKVSINCRPCTNNFNIITFHWWFLPWWVLFLYEYYASFNPYFLLSLYFDILKPNSLEKLTCKKKQNKNIIIIDLLITSKECDLVSLFHSWLLKKVSVFKSDRWRFRVIRLEKPFNGLTLSPVKNGVISA